MCRSVYILAAKALLHLPHDWTRRKQGGLEVLTIVGMSIWLGDITVVDIRGSLPELHVFGTNFSLAGHINELQSRQCQSSTYFKLGMLNGSHFNFSFFFEEEVV